MNRVTIKTPECPDGETIDLWNNTDQDDIEEAILLTARLLGYWPSEITIEFQDN